MALRPKAVEVSSTVERYLVLPRYLQTYTKKSLFMLARVGDPEFNLIGSHGYLFFVQCIVMGKQILLRKGYSVRRVIFYIKYG